MFKFVIVILAFIACAAAKPGLLPVPLAYTAPAAVVAAPTPFVTATSSQFVARNHNGIATAPILAPVATPVIAKTIAPVAAPLSATAPLAYTAPLTYPAHLPYAAPVLL